MCVLCCESSRHTHTHTHTRVRDMSVVVPGVRGGQRWEAGLALRAAWPGRSWGMSPWPPSCTGQTLTRISFGINKVLFYSIFLRVPPCLMLCVIGPHPLNASPSTWHCKHFLAQTSPPKIDSDSACLFYINVGPLVGKGKIENIICCYQNGAISSSVCGFIEAGHLNKNAHINSKCHVRKFSFPVFITSHYWLNYSPSVCH